MGTIRDWGPLENMWTTSGSAVQRNMNIAFLSPSWSFLRSWIKSAAALGVAAASVDHVLS